MRKIIAWLLAAVLAGSMTACADKGGPIETVPTGTKPTLTEPTGNEEVSIGHEDTYWVAESCQLSGEEGENTPQTLDPDEWTMDLLIRVDGTARYRDIHEGICLMDDSCRNLTWERSAEGEFLFYSVLYPEPILRGIYEKGILTLKYWESTVTMRQESLPQTVGQQYAPAELAGTWLMVSGETEGYEWEAMPAELSSLVFKVTAYDGPLVMSADMEERDYFGHMLGCGYGLATEVLPEPLYEGCANEAWAVRIGEESPRDENGFPTQTEFYATLLGEDTLMLQRYYTMDGYPAVSHQIYWRLTDLVSWMEPDSMKLDYANWVCTGYEGESGEFPELEGLSVVLCPDHTCNVTFGDGSSQEGTWELGAGGVVRLCGAEDYDDPFWFGGAISGYWVDTVEGSVETYQMALYYKGGIMKLTLNSYG